MIIGRAPHKGTIKILVLHFSQTAFNMAVTEGLLYAAGMAIVLGSIFVLKYTDTENSLTKLVLYIPMWISGRCEKLNLEDIPGKYMPPKPEYSSKWWKGEKQFQLERRAIFSKVCILELSYRG